MNSNKKFISAEESLGISSKEYNKIIEQLFLTELDEQKQKELIEEKPNKTSLQYDNIITMCQNIFEKKMKDYGIAWRILRPTSMTDQIYIKARRIRSIEETGVQLVNDINDDIKSEFIGIINYCVMALINLELGTSENEDLSYDEIKSKYLEKLNIAKDLMMKKNHDYGEAWRNMRISSYTDLILMKIFRTKQVEDNKGKTIISEGIDANYLDMINYSIFALIKFNE